MHGGYAWRIHAAADVPLVRVRVGVRVLVMSVVMVPMG